MRTGPRARAQDQDTSGGDARATSPATACGVADRLKKYVIDPHGMVKA